MKILFLNESDITGGAAKAAYRLYKNLQEREIFCKMLTQHKDSDDTSIIGPASNISKSLVNLKIALDHFPKILYPKRKNTVFHAQWFPSIFLKKTNKCPSDIVHLHWICRGFLSIGKIAKLNEPIIWTLHDMWPFTGGCHYAGGCEGYTKSCGKCPQLGSQIAHDLSSWTWKRKAKVWQNLNLSFVAPSMWIKTLAQKSSLLHDKIIEVIPNGIDIELFCPHDRKSLRSHLGLPLDKKLILFSAINAISDQRKGFPILLPALRQFAETKTAANTEIVILGAARPKNPPEFGLKSTYMGRIHDEVLISLICAACDVFVAPSKEDNLPNTIMEAMACGTPCVAFSIGGVPEMITHKTNGYLAHSFSIEELARGIEWVVKDNDRYNELSMQARQKAETRFDVRLVTDQHMALYEKTIQQRSK